MRKVVIVAVMVLSLGFASQALAQQGGGRFDTIKARILRNLGERIARLQDVKACMEKASTPAQLRDCRQKYGPPQRGHAGQPGPRNQ